MAVDLHRRRSLVILFSKGEKDQLARKKEEEPAPVYGK